MTYFPRVRPALGVSQFAALALACVLAALVGAGIGLWCAAVMR